MGKKSFFNEFFKKTINFLLNKYMRKDYPVDFSVVIPTYNRSEYLQKSILSALRQEGVTFEIIVSDDNSSDDTEKKVKSLKDKRIRYFRNKNRLGISMNFRRCFLLSKGRFIFTLGDDDLILDKTTLREVLKVMNKYSVGMAKIGTITYERFMKEPYQIWNLSDDLIVLKPDKVQNILKESIRFGIGFFSGLIFDNRNINREKLIPDHDCYVDHMCHSYNRIAFDLIKRLGIAYIPNYFILSHLSLNLIPRYFNMKDHGRLYFEEPINQVKEYISGKEFDDFKKEYIKDHIVMLPNIKYFTSNINYLRVLRRIIHSCPNLLTNKEFLVWTFLGFLPKYFIKFLREVKILITRKNISSFLSKHSFGDKIQDLYIFIKNYEYKT